MKRTYLAMMVSLISIASVTQAAVTLTTDAQKVGYAMGVDIGRNLVQSFNDEKITEKVDLNAIIVGLHDIIEGKSVLMEKEEVDKTLQSFIENQIQQRRDEWKKYEEENLKKGEDFLKDNATQEGVKVTSSGLQYKVLKEGNGKKPTLDDKVSVSYEGKLIDGKVFHSADSGAETFSLKNVIPGWAEGLQLMSEGSEYEFYIPANLAYGTESIGDTIPPNSVLIFKLELKKIGGDEEDGGVVQQTDTNVKSNTSVDKDSPQAAPKDESLPPADSSSQETKKEDAAGEQ